MSASASAGALRAPTAPSVAGAAGGSWCTFWLGERCFGVDTSIVGEVVSVTGFVPVPLCPPAVLGVFALRGAPVALLDLSVLCGLPVVVGSRTEERQALAALVLRTRTTLAALAIDRMFAVVPAGRGVYTPSDPAAEHPAVQGLLAVQQPEPHVVTLLRAATLLELLKQVRFR